MGRFWNGRGKAWSDLSGGGAGLTPKDFPVEHSVIGRVGYPSPPGREFAYSPSYFFPSKRIAERKFLFLPLKFIYSSHEWDLLYMSLCFSFFLGVYILLKAASSYRNQDHYICHYVIGFWMRDIPSIYYICHYAQRNWEYSITELRSSYS